MVPLGGGVPPVPDLASGTAGTAEKKLSSKWGGDPWDPFSFLSQVFHKIYFELAKWVISQTESGVFARPKYISTIGIHIFNTLTAIGLDIINRSM